ncbi:Glycerol uptake facilitator [Hoeflea phototrophica DFL-43]|uniref:Glycerol uptake facilitator n=1 Tax=Hoeflea phototrophica (strain DSM 17068 / NCIMB 14078 / DFL-43) TaxID=411684 RepID=A9D6Q9_HOEPD|nr:MIP/aquaporin family protein [Hoeflea phototrophica]EDQ33571.1 Glycerol uptake facilitator [Hoeflea phototrophica DFL-43]
MSKAPRSARLLAEAAGTAFLLATVVGSGIMAETLSGGNVALALLANTIATGAILVVLISAFGPISGAHFNPAVTLVFRLRGEIGNGEALAFVAVQIVSGIIGVWVAHLMFDQTVIQTSVNVRTGPGQWVSEAVATFGLIATILFGIRAKANVAMMVGLYITAAYWFTASTSFANPAVTIARSLTDSFSGILPAHAPGFIAAQIVGAVAALAFFRMVRENN